jgi:hypothetical protein
LGSAITTSPTKAKLATDAAHGRVGQHADVGQLGLGQARQRGIGLGHLHQAQQAFLHARAAGGGEADEGHLLLDGGLTPRTKRSPTTEPIEPPMKSNSKQAATTGTLITAPPITTSASVSPVFSSASFRRSGYLLAVLELQRVDRQHLLADLVAAFGVEEGVQPGARADAVVVAHLGQTFWFCSRSVL